MADETEAEKFAAAESEHDVAPAANPPTAAAALRDFEDTNFGRDATRINGSVERGIGSRFQSMSPGKRAEYDALEAMVKAEQDIADSSAKLDKARLDHDAALEKLAAAQKASEAAMAESDHVELT